jgi:hypothetical protein
LPETESWGPSHLVESRSIAIALGCAAGTQGEEIDGDAIFGSGPDKIANILVG